MDIASRSSSSLAGLKRGSVRPARPGGDRGDEGGGRGHQSGDGGLPENDVLCAVHRGPAIRYCEGAHRNAIGAAKFTQQWYDTQKTLALASQKKRYPGDWVYSFVEGVPGRFDWGWDYTECGIIKLYEPSGNMNLVPRFCELAFVESERQGTGLRRTTTLARGGKVCDFRYRQGLSAR